MNPEPLSSYKEKAYNPGSPAPDPIREQFGSFPLQKQINSTPTFNSSFSNPKNPLKLTFSCKRKIDQVSDSDSEEEITLKQPKMDENFMKEVLEALAHNRVQMETFTVAVNDFKDFKGETHTRLSAVEANVEEIKTKLDNGIGPADIEKIKAALLPELKESFGADFKSQIDNSHKAKLAKEVWDHDHSMIIHGLRCDCSPDDINNFLEKEMTGRLRLSKAASLAEPFCSRTVLPEFEPRECSEGTGPVPGLGRSGGEK